MKKYQLLFLMLYLALCVKQSHQWILYQKHNVEKIDEYFLDQKQNVTILKDYELINFVKVTGPESITFDCKGEGSYVGVSDGWILKWHGPKLGWKEFAIPLSIRKRELCDESTNPNLEPICGRPLGLKFNPVTCDLYTGDAYFGLLMIGPNGGIAQTIVSSIERITFNFINGLDIDNRTGVIYFTDSSTIFQRRYGMKNFLPRSTDSSGRLLKYDLYTKTTSVIYTSLMFPNGVALSKNYSFLLVAETIRRKILKFNLGTNKFELEVFVALPRVPDNMKMNHKGEFWVALNAGRLGEIDDDVLDPIGIGIKKRELCNGSTNPNLEPICGRSLGLKFNSVTCDLYIGDAYFDLLRIGPGGITQTLVSSVKGIQFKFINGLDIYSSTGVIYFIDSSTTFQRSWTVEWKRVV
ncbi:hypothetical protein J1N35_003998 [Gossypium stocksii]|uniref:Strictosidine synthase conserved region domain-containing protein n=1 Tax=Gossypium stocksii TaxID=47602 RepID=A0A9D3WBV9_9ROSI|nr:hypothetical protein J1N35_003998 [Gossypium stocksii]